MYDAGDALTEPPSTFPTDKGMTEPKRCKEAGGLEIVTDEAEAFVLID
jgi:hypothetical protein